MSILRHEIELNLAPLVDQNFLKEDCARALLVGGSPEFRQDIEHVLSDFEVKVVDDPCQKPTLIIDMGILHEGRDAWQKSFRRTISVLTSIYDFWASEKKFGSLVYLAVLQDHAGEFLIEQGIWSGVAKSISREFPCAIGRVVTIPFKSASPGKLLVDFLERCRVIEGVHDGNNIFTPLAMVRNSASQKNKLGASDTVVMTGGARGIGFALARELAARGCRVLVSGRENLDFHALQDWVYLSDHDFKLARRDALIEANVNQIKDIRLEFARRHHIRSIFHNLQQASDDGLYIQYVQCDVLDADSVTHLVDQAGEKLSVFIHNAGIDIPASLLKKSVKSMESVIAVKLEGYKNVRSALNGRQIDTLALTGSLTGRYGGMRGQIDYSAANECLAFASRFTQHGDNPRIVCTSWPTWYDLGLISNLEAASQYMEPICVDEGVDLWIRELEADTQGEISFMGEFAAVSPQQLIGISVPSDWEGTPELLARRFFLGKIEVYCPDKKIVSIHDLSSPYIPWLRSAELAGQPALPVSAVIEYLVRSTDGFIFDFGLPAYLEDIHINLLELALTNSSFVRRTAQVIGTNTIEVTLTKFSDETSEDVLLASCFVHCISRNEAGDKDLSFDPEFFSVEDDSEVVYRWPGTHSTMFCYNSAVDNFIFQEPFRTIIPVSFVEDRIRAFFATRPFISSIRLKGIRIFSNFQFSEG